MADSSPVPTPKPNHRTVSRADWRAVSKDLLAQEKALTHQRDKVTAARLNLPRVRMEKDYLFDTPQGKRSLGDLFEGRSQLLLYHFMMGPEWKAGCPGCSFQCDNFDGTLPHLNNHDVTLVAVARAPLANIEAYKRRMGWHFPFVSSLGSDFNFDFHVSFTPEQLKGEVEYNFEMIPGTDAHDELPGMSVFERDEDGTVYHTYSSYGRGGEEVLTTLMLLDMAPKGRNEQTTMDFVKRHDEYAGATKAHDCCA